MKLIFFTFPILFTTCLASSNTFILSGIPGESPLIEFSFRHPSMNDSYASYDISTLSGTYEFNLSFPVNDMLDAEASIPYLVETPVYDPSPYVSFSSKRALGNITVSINSSYKHWQEKGWTGSVNISLPVMSDAGNAVNTGTLGMLTEYFRGFGKYSPQTLTIGAIYSSVNRSNTTNISLGYEIGPALRIPVDGEGTEVFLEYGTLASMELNDVNLSLELVGLVNLTSSGNSGDRFDHAVVLGGRWVGTAVKPGVFYQMNLGNISDTIIGVLGLDVEIEL
jgi:hypothetical protein